jgi:hypothetical protein
MRIEIRPCIAPDGRQAVLFQADEFHLIVPPGDALEWARDLAAVARGILAERN